MILQNCLLVRGEVQFASIIIIFGVVETWFMSTRSKDQGLDDFSMSVAHSLGDSGWPCSALLTLSTCPSGIGGLPLLFHHSLKGLSMVT